MSAPVESVRLFYTGIALLVPTLAGVWYLSNPHASVWQRQRIDLPLDPWTLLLVGVFIGAMIYVGPYLEFPSDPVDHLAFIQSWEKARWMNYIYSDSYYSSRFVYFFEHWLLQPSGLSFGNRTGLLFLSPVLQGILFWQFIRITKILTNNTILSQLGGLMSLGFFGYNAISFYRYTVLAGTLLAYIIFLEGLILIISTFSKEEWRYLFLLPPLLAFCWQNHPQETLLQLNGMVGICITLLLFRYKGITPRFRNIMALVTIMVITVSVFILFKREVLSENIASPLISYYKLFGLNINLLQFQHLNLMLGGLGWFAILSAALILLFNSPNRNLDIMAGLCIWSIVILYNPLSIEVLLRFIPTDVFSRLIYGSIYWIFIVIFIQDLHNKIRKIDNVLMVKANILLKNKILPYIVILILFSLSGIPGYPVYGKVRHLGLKVDPRLDGSNLQPTIEYLRLHTPKSCVDPYPNPAYLPIMSYVLSDSYVNTYLVGTGYFYIVTNRRDIKLDNVPSVDSTVSDNDTIDYSSFRNSIKSKKICYVILYVQTEELHSWVGAVLGHWRIDHARTQRYYSANFIEWVTKNPQDFELVFTDNLIRVFKVL
ncbi:hypothetical protein H6F98_13905 [Microcoleus sp. FACHB-SPT15]|uniref:hypothetical protein n=1 Tax=Microcoleus sp. FACHB-SPT15 TaxID=2692830 RepID=UPI001784655C|nr:hypothetical protein [Microcoleus sp. FACHB-SPT15]MBD1806541.1 hypothetical protein [Microcoleus sp. FACHB-SPT15]